MCKSDVHIRNRHRPSAPRTSPLKQLNPQGIASKVRTKTAYLKAPKQLQFHLTTPLHAREEPPASYNNVTGSQRTDACNYDPPESRADACAAAHVCKQLHMAALWRLCDLAPIFYHFRYSLHKGKKKLACRVQQRELPPLRSHFNRLKGNFWIASLVTIHQRVYAFLAGNTPWKMVKTRSSLDTCTTVSRVTILHREEFSL